MKDEESDDVKEGEMLREEMRVVMSKRVSLIDDGEGGGWVDGKG